MIQLSATATTSSAKAALALVVVFASVGIGASASLDGASQRLAQVVASDAAPVTVALPFAFAAEAGSTDAAPAAGHHSGASTARNRSLASRDGVLAVTSATSTGEAARLRPVMISPAARDLGSEYPRLLEAALSEVVPRVSACFSQVREFAIAADDDILVVEVWTSLGVAEALGALADFDETWTLRDGLDWGANLVVVARYV